jgi:hypothetical protein
VLVLSNNRGSEEHAAGRLLAVNIIENLGASCDSSSRTHTQYWGLYLVHLNCDIVSVYQYMATRNFRYHELKTALAAVDLRVCLPRGRNEAAVNSWALTILLA